MTSSGTCLINSSLYTLTIFPFTSAPILLIPNPDRPFVVEVDASEVGVGAILSQRGEDGKLHPCAFMSRRLSDAERNYHVGDRELLAAKFQFPSSKSNALTTCLLQKK